jgi:hypothetical protein
MDEMAHAEAIGRNVRIEEPIERRERPPETGPSPCEFIARPLYSYHCPFAELKHRLHGKADKA